MNSNLKNLSLEERIRLVEELWDSIASDQVKLPMTEEQKAELDRRLDRLESSNVEGRPVEEAIEDIRKRL